MNIGLVIPTRPPLATTKNIVTIAQRAEELGFSFVTIPDHIVAPADFNRAYPYAESGAMSWGPSGDVLEMLSLMTFVLGKTTRLRAVTGIMVVPLRNPLFAAKALATIDVLSNGRVGVGCGVGWEHHEFAALGVPPFKERGKVTTEYIELFKELWTKDQPRFDGQYVKFSEMPFLPKPVQKPHPPIWVGGESPGAMRRAARLGDCWYPIGSNQKQLMDTPERYSAGLQQFNRHLAEANRKPEDIELAYCSLWYAEEKAKTLENGQRRSFTGTQEQVAGDIAAFGELGVKHLVLNLQANTLDETLGRMERLMTKVVPLVKS
ncbi:MAG: TIGR03619 family F420-dependent LLM class oxidoreductase [Betaproteobacteria bacterium]|nr:TIGR03619 family F420-dependent LLM class oxidoreductase [Betaproteobacteria bacterium]